mmetsp:Transcript_9722/g.16391  ORF Transcript_9722/g.16391 Transcript_9722/m.16391 type:complete len:159 (+) Transcript_9722:75-551(+)
MFNCLFLILVSLILIDASKISTQNELNDNVAQNIGACQCRYNKFQDKCIATVNECRPYGVYVCGHKNATLGCGGPTEANCKCTLPQPTPSPTPRPTPGFRPTPKPTPSPTPGQSNGSCSCYGPVNRLGCLSNNWANRCTGGTQPHCSPSGRTCSCECL